MLIFFTEKILQNSWFFPCLRCKVDSTLDLHWAKKIWCNIQQQYKTNVNVPCGKQSNDLTNKKANNVIPEKTTKSLFLALRVTLWSGFLVRNISFEICKASFSGHQKNCHTVSTSDPRHNMIQDLVLLSFNHNTMSYDMYFTKYGFLEKSNRHFLFGNLFLRAEKFLH